MQENICYDGILATEQRRVFPNFIFHRFCDEADIRVRAQLLFWPEKTPPQREVRESA